MSMEIMNKNILWNSDCWKSCGTSWFADTTLPGSQRCLPLNPKTFLADPKNDSDINKLKKKI